MNKKKIETDYKNKIKLLIKYNKFYFDKDRPIVTDNTYDDLKKEIFILEKKFKFLNSRSSPSQNVGHKPSKNFKKANHKIPMLSLSNAIKIALL